MDLTDAYENGAYIEGAEQMRAAWPVDAAAFRQNARGVHDVPYGAAPRERFDLFEPEGRSRGLMVFIHGGYWHATYKDDWSHYAAGALARGWTVAMPGYTLCPDIRISGITAQISAAITEAAGRVPGPIAIAGHSAGGHLAARMACEGVLPQAVAKRVRSVMPISPLTDLAPLMQTDMNAVLGIDADEAQTESPVHCVPLEVPVHVWVGADERPAFLDQAMWLSQAWGAQLTEASGAHHFNVIDPLMDPDSFMLNWLLAE